MHFLKCVAPDLRPRPIRSANAVALLQQTGKERRWIPAAAGMTGSPINDCHEDLRR